ncbi:MAG: hypothetical protein IT294_04355 [Deltaproteobacteria bacterium]|nr:hypothetical protein [Deltaproteobacteria bacterium]
MRLDDEQIERYSRQLILREIGPRGQERLLATRVAVAGADAAAERVVAYLAAAGIGWIAGEPGPRAAADPDQPDLTLAPLAAATGAACDAAVIVAPTIAAAADALAPWRTGAATVFWIAAGRAGALPPCPRCAAAALTVGEVEPALAPLRDGVLATVVATEVVKATLAIGTPLAGRVLAYDPATATLATATPTGRCAH